MSDMRKVLLTSVGIYVQDEDGKGWTFLPKSGEEDIPIDESMRHLTNEEAEHYFQYEIDMANFRAAVESLRACIEEVVRVLHDWIANIVPVVYQAILDRYKEKPQRPDYKARPNCCTRAKVKPHKKQRSRER